MTMNAFEEAQEDLLQRRRNAGVAPVVTAYSHLPAGHQAAALEILTWLRGVGPQTSDSIASQFGLPIHATYNIVSAMKKVGAITTAPAYVAERDRMMPQHTANPDYSTEKERS